DGPRLQNLLATEGEEVAGEGRRPFRRARDQLEVVSRLSVQGLELEGETAAARDDGEKVVEVVGDASRELADGLHLLRLQELLLQSLALGDVGEHAHAADVAPVRVEQRSDGKDHVDEGAVLAAPLGLEASHRSSQAVLT